MFELERAEISKSITFGGLRLDQVVVDCFLSLKIVSNPVWTRNAVHLVVQDDNHDLLRLAIYNWSIVNDSRQIKSFSYVKQRFKQVFALNSRFLLFDPWLKVCDDRNLSLRCDSPETNLFLIDFYRTCSDAEMTNIDQLRQIGNSCYQFDDNLAAIEFYTFALKQIERQRKRQILGSNQISSFVRSVSRSNF